LDPGIGRASGRKGKWSAVEDSKLKDAVQTRGGQNWGGISALVPGRTHNQCRQTWNDALNPNIDQASGRTGKWTAVEDSQLKDAVQTHCDKDWAAISSHIPGRTRIQCQHRWNNTFNPSIGRASARKGKWAEDEDSKLKDAAQMHGDKDWSVVAALVPGRTKTQCYQRWHNELSPSIGQAGGREKGRWTAAEDSKLQHAVQTHGDKDWVTLSALVPGRSKKQCYNRWSTVQGRYKAPALGQDPHSP
jgi:hypothetical protein